MVALPSNLKSKQTEDQPPFSEATRQRLCSNFLHVTLPCFLLQIVKALAVPELRRSPEQCLQSWKMRSWISSSVAAADQKTRSSQETQKQMKEIWIRMEDYVGQSVVLKNEALVCNIQMDQMDMSISKLFIELPNYVCTEVLQHWPLWFLAKKCPWPMPIPSIENNQLNFNFQLLQVRNADLPRTRSATQIFPTSQNKSPNIRDVFWGIR